MELITNQLFEREELIKKLSYNLAVLDQTIQQVNYDLAERDKTIQKLSIVLAEREREVLYYANSKSWRITRPLRKIMRCLRRK